MGPSAFRIAGLGESASPDWATPLQDRGDLAVPIPETRLEGDTRKRYVNDIATVCGALFDAPVRR
jgi:hypothetical protein